MRHAKQRSAAVLLALAASFGCGGSKEAEPKTAALPPKEAAAPMPVEAPLRPAEDDRCARVRRGPNDDLAIVLEKVDPKLTAALDRPPAEAAAEWAEELRRMSEGCKEAHVEHAVPAKRVALSAPAGCKKGAPSQDLVFDFGPDAPSSQLGVTGHVSVQGRPVALDVRVEKSTEPTSLCAVGRISTGEASRPAPSTPADAGTTASFLPVAFQMIGSVLGLIPFER